MLLSKVSKMLHFLCAFILLSQNAWGASRAVEECGYIYRANWEINIDLLSKIFVNVPLDGISITDHYNRSVDSNNCPNTPRVETHTTSDGHIYTTKLVTEMFWDKYRFLSYKACKTTFYIQVRKPEYGIESFESCEIKKTTGELNEYISQNKVSIANDGKDLLQFQSNFYSEEKNQIAMGCLIANYQADAIYSGLATELKTQFQNAFSIFFDSSAFTPDVCAQSQASSIQSATCADSDTSTKCGNLRRYRDNLALLQSKKAEIIDLKNDVVPRQNAAYAAELDGLISLMPQEARN